MGRQLTHKQAKKKVLSKHKGTLWLISKYTKSRDKHEFECQCGNTWWASFDSVANNGTGCPKCAKGGRKFKPNRHKPSVKYWDCIAVQLLNIKLEQVGVFYVDFEDWENIKGYRWYLNNYGYVVNDTLGLLHRFLMDCPKDMLVDHIKHNPLDNRKCRLRICTRTENNRNRRTSLNSRSGLKGVFPNHNNWMARISIEGKLLYLGTFDTKREAALVYNWAARKHFGKFAKLNKDPDKV